MGECNEVMVEWDNWCITGFHFILGSEEVFDGVMLKAPFCFAQLINYHKNYNKNVNR